MASRSYIRVCFVSLSAFCSLTIFILSLPPALPPNTIRNGEGKSYLFVFAVLTPTTRH